MAKTETIKKDRDVLSNHIKTIRNLIGSERFADDLIEFLDTYSAGNHTLLNEAVFDIAGKHDIIFDDDGNLDEEYADSYHASAKKSKMKKTPLVDINADDIALSINFYSSGYTDVENGTVKFDAQGDFLGGSRYGEEGITTYVERFTYPISDFVNPNIIREIKGMVADAMIDQINDQWRIKDGNIEFFNDFANINGYEASAKKSKSFNEMIKEQRKQYKNKKVL